MNTINKLYTQNKTIFIWVFVINIFSFGFMLTNTYYTHDSMSLSGFLPFTYYLVNEGRFTGLFLNNILSDGVQLPFLMLSVSLIVNCISSILLSEIFDIKKDINKFIIASLFTTFPYWSEAYVYYFMDFAYAIRFLLSFVAIILLKNNITLVKIIVAILLYAFALFAYQDVLMFIPTLLVSMFILNLLSHKDKYKIMLLKLIQNSIIFVLSIGFYLILVKLMQYMLYGKVVPISYEGGGKFIVFDNIKHFIHASLYFYRSFTFYSSPITKGLFIFLFILTLVLTIIKKINIVSKILLLITFGSLLFIPDIMELVHVNARYYHLTMFAYPFVYITIFLSLLKLINSKKFSIVITLLMIIPIYTYTKNNIFFQYNANNNYLNNYYKYSKIIDKSLDISNKNHQTYNLYIVVDPIEEDTCLRSKELHFKDIFIALKLTNYKQKFCTDLMADIKIHNPAIAGYVGISFAAHIILERKIKALTPQFSWTGGKYAGLISNRKFTYLRNKEVHKQLVKNTNYLKLMKYDKYSDYSYRYIIIGNDLIFKTKEMNNN